jgi:hypothetical protein
MEKVCEVCENKKITNKIYENVTCYFCDETVLICELCKKYYYGNDGLDDCIIVPNKYKNIINSLKNHPPQCRKCMNENTKNKYEYCDGCTTLRLSNEFIECPKCFSSCCAKCNGHNVCWICNSILDENDKNHYDKYKFCHRCRKHKLDREFIPCDNCLFDSCGECNGHGVCSVCKSSLNK